MKTNFQKLIICIAILFTGFVGAQTVVHDAKVRIKTVPLGLVTDSLLVIDVSGNVKYFPISSLPFGGGGGGATNLGYTASPTDGTITNDNGTNTTVPLADGVNAGFITPAEKTQIATNKTNADASKVKTDFTTVTQTVDLDQMETDVGANNSKVSYTDATAVGLNTAKTGITVQQANEIIANNAKVTNTDNQNANEVSNTPSGNLAATNVQGALDELQTEIDGVSPKAVVEYSTSSNYTTINADIGKTITVNAGATVITLSNDFGLTAGFNQCFYNNSGGSLTWAFGTNDSSNTSDAIPDGMNACIRYLGNVSGGEWDVLIQGTVTFDGLADTDITSPLDGQIAVFNSSTGKWENSTPASGGNLSDANGPNTGEYGKFASPTSLEGRTEAELKADLSLEIGVDIQAYNAVLGNITNAGSGLIITAAERILWNLAYGWGNHDSGAYGKVGGANTWSNTNTFNGVNTYSGANTHSGTNVFTNFMYLRNDSGGFQIQKADGSGVGNFGWNDTSGKIILSGATFGETIMFDGKVEVDDDPTIDAQIGNRGYNDARYLQNSGAANLSGVALVLDSQIGKYYNMASANSGTTYTFSGSVTGGWATSLINTTTEPHIETTTDVTAGSFVVGKSYTILTVGTTDFTAIGASASTIGIVFTATGVGTGTGTATLNLDKMPGATWVTGTDMEMFIKHDGTTTRYCFIKLTE